MTDQNEAIQGTPGAAWRKEGQTDPHGNRSSQGVGMNDRELLELAAKAAGIAIHHWTDGCEPHDCPVLNDGINKAIILFDPLTNDGDALKLVVKLNLDINAYPKSQEVAAVQHRQNIGAYHRSIERIRDNPYAATRRAIVRAAAEIGRAMQ